MSDHKLTEITGTPVAPSAFGSDNLEPNTVVAPKLEIKPFSIFSKREKWVIVAIAAMAGFFSPLASNLYFPAIPQMAAAFRVSTELINLTVTVYMVLQGIAPLLWGSLADQSGRRLALLGTMITLAASSIGLALVPTSAYWGLMLLRCLQAAGSASTFALGAGIVADISLPSERGSSMSLFYMGPLVGPCVGPIIGGALAQGLGWRSMFWFLLIASAVAILIILLFLPETLRALVGDGSVPPPKIHAALIPIIGRSRWQTGSGVERPPRRKFENPFTLFVYPDVSLLLFLNSVTVSVQYSITASISTLFVEIYPFLTETEIGLCFLAIGGGMFAASLINGRLLDKEFARVRKNAARQRSNEHGGKVENSEIEDITKHDYFPIERARLGLLPIYLVVFMCCVIPYGWVLRQRVSLAVPLILHIFIGYCTFSIMNATMTLTVDLTPGRSSAVTACNNFTRASLSAVMVSVIDIIIRAMGVGWTFTLLGCICGLCIPLTFLEFYMGPIWRARRLAKSQANE